MSATRVCPSNPLIAERGARATQAVLDASRIYPASEWRSGPPTSRPHKRQGPRVPQGAVMALNEEPSIAGHPMSLRRNEGEQFRSSRNLSFQR
jgi:hypothetical protein